MQQGRRRRGSSRLSGCGPWAASGPVHPGPCSVQPGTASRDSDAQPVALGSTLAEAINVGSAGLAPLGRAICGHTDFG